MKKNCFLFLTALLLSSVSMAQEPNSLEGSLMIDFVCEHINNNSGQINRPRNPIEPPTVYLNDHTLYIYSDGRDFDLQVVASDETVVYSTYVSSSITEVQLPSTLSGAYHLELFNGDYVFIGGIAL